MWALKVVKVFPPQLRAERPRSVTETRTIRGNGSVSIGRMRGGAPRRSRRGGGVGVGFFVWAWLLPHTNTTYCTPLVCSVWIAAATRTAWLLTLPARVRVRVAVGSGHGTPQQAQAPGRPRQKCKSLGPTLAPRARARARDPQNQSRRYPVSRVEKPRCVPFPSPFPFPFPSPSC